MVESLLNVFENIYDSSNSKLGKTEDKSTLADATKGVAVLNKEMSKTLLLANEIGQKRLLDWITKKLIEKETFQGHTNFAIFSYFCIFQ